MIREQQLLRILQALTLLTFTAAAVLALKIAGLFQAGENRAENEKPALQGVSKTLPASSLQTSVFAGARGKVPRTARSGDKTFAEWMSKGDRRTENGDFESAMAAYRQASNLAPKELGPYEKIAAAALTGKHYQTALEQYRMLAAAVPGNQTFALGTVRSLIGLRKLTEAKVKLETLAPETSETILVRGTLAAAMNDADGAKKFLRKSAAAPDADAATKQKTERLLAVYREFEVARDGRPEYLQAELAQAFDQNGEYALAIETALRALQTAREYRDLWIILGHAFLNERAWIDADSALTRAIALDASHPSAFFFRGLARRRLAKNQESATDFQEALKLNWQPAILAKQHLADTLFELHNFEDAQKLYKEIALANPELPAAHLNLAALLEQQGELEEARQEYETVRTLSEKSGNEDVRSRAEEGLERLKKSFAGAQNPAQDAPQAPSFSASFIPSLSLQ